MTGMLKRFGSWLENVAMLFEPPSPYDLLDARLAQLEQRLAEVEAITEEMADPMPPSAESSAKQPFNGPEGAASDTQAEDFVQ